MADPDQAEDAVRRSEYSGKLAHGDTFRGLPPTGGAVSQKAAPQCSTRWQELSLTEACDASVHSLHVEGQVGVVGASRVGRRLLGIFNDGAYRVLLDLSHAEPIAPAALVGTLLRIDRYATRRGARLVVVPGEAMEPTLDLRSTRGLLTIAATREQAEAMLA